MENPEHVLMELNSLEKEPQDCLPDVSVWRYINTYINTFLEVLEPKTPSPLYLRTIRQKMPKKGHQKIPLRKRLSSNKSLKKGHFRGQKYRLI